MKKRCYLLMVSMLVIMFSGCGQQETKVSDKAGIPGMIENLYNGSYEYTRSETFLDSKGEEKTVLFQGEVQQNPYKEHILVVNPDEDTVITEYEYSGNGAMVNAKLKQDGEWVKTKVDRIYPYGYGEELTLTLEGKEEEDGKSLEVYETSYSVDVAKQYNLSENLTAQVTQRYYLDTSNQEIVKNVTDLSDLELQNAIAIDVTANGTQMRQAKEKAEQQGNYQRNIVMNITSQIPAGSENK